MTSLTLFGCLLILATSDNGATWTLLWFDEL